MEESNSMAKKNVLFDMPCEKKHSYVVSIDKSGVITRINDEFEGLIGYKKNEVLSKPFTKLIPSNEYRERWDRFFDYTHDQFPLDDFDLPILTKNGSIIPIVWNGFAVKEPESYDIEKIGLVGTLALTDQNVNNTKMMIDQREGQQRSAGKNDDNRKVR